VNLADEMWAYVDESGCMGMKVGSGSSPFFVVTVVLFNDKTVVTACYDRIEELKTTFKVKSEFKFCRCSHEQRVGFFRELCHFDFSYFGIVFDKSQIARFHRPFLHYAVLGAFAQHAEKIRCAKVVIDKTGSSEFRKMMSKELKDQLNDSYGSIVINAVKSVESDTNNLLQLADMVCGAVARSFHPDKCGRNGYRDMLRKKEWGITQIP
jgi:hypothetical protein